MELVRPLKLSIPEIKVYRRKTKHGELKTSKCCQENPKAGDINYGEIAHGNDKSRNTVIRDVIAIDTMVTVLSQACLCMEGLDGRRLMEHLSAR